MFVRQKNGDLATSDAGRRADASKGLTPDEGRVTASDQVPGGVKILPTFAVPGYFLPPSSTC